MTVSFIADGLDIASLDFISPGGQHVFVDYRDLSGAGTSVPTGGSEAFGDASSIAAQGNELYNLQDYSPLSSRRPCDIRIEGVAPGTSLVGLDIFGDESEGFTSSFLHAINYAVTVDHVNVLNESLGNNFSPDDAAALDMIKQANDEAGAAVAFQDPAATAAGTASVTLVDPNGSYAGNSQKGASG